MEKRREVIVPKTKDAEYALDYDEATTDQLDTLFLTKNYYNQFWRSGILDLLNQLSPQSLIADYETACINDPIILTSILAAFQNKQGFSSTLAPELTEELIGLFEKSLERKTGVYFYL
jgi:hypothetical protein